MSWITRCPACGVTYKVVPDQLKVAQGWLRCGQCQHAFDSTGMVLSWPIEGDPSESTVLPEDAAERVDLEDFLKCEDKPALQTPVAAFEEALSTFKPQPLATTQAAPSAEVFGVPLGDMLAPNAAPDDPLLVLQPTSSWWPMVVAWFLLLGLMLQGIGVARYQLVAAEPTLAQPLLTVCRL
jgi:predicted Zn finger-like uncharacterized protein